MVIVIPWKEMRGYIIYDYMSLNNPKENMGICFDLYSCIKSYGMYFSSSF